MAARTLPGIDVFADYAEAAQAEKTRVPGRIVPDLHDFQNPHKIFHHIDRIHELWATGDTRPVHMTIGLTNHCNHTCPWCYINWNQAGALSLRSGNGEAGKKVINADMRLIEATLEAKELGLKAVTIVGDGEPTLHKNIVEYLDILHGGGLDIGIFTNMGMKQPEIVEALAKTCFFVRCSIDSMRAEVHKKFHGLDDFDLVIDNIRRLIARRGDNPYPIIGVQYVTNEENYLDLPEAARFYRDLGVEYLTIKPMYKAVLNPAHEKNKLDYGDAERLMREAESHSTDTFKVYAKYSQFSEILNNETNGGRYYKKCQATPLSPYLDEDGNVEMCGNLKGRGFTMGNIYESSFQEIWQSERRQDCLRRIDLLKCPAGCKLDPLNKVLWDAFYPETRKAHSNFV